MAQDEATSDEHGAGAAVSSPFATPWDWKHGAIAGFVATATMGVAITVMDLPTLRTAIAGLYGLEGSLAAGWLAHLVHGTVFGAIFAAILADPGLHRVSEWLWKTLVAGLVYGLVLAVVGAGIIMPMWLGLAGVSVDIALPNVTVPSLLWHAIYGVVLGAGFHVLERR